MPSPTRFTAITVIATATPGMNERYGAERSTPRPSAIIAPQVATFGSPMPRNDRAASIRIALATITEASVTVGGSALGSTSRNAIATGCMPSARYASTKSRWRRLRISARTSRAGPVHELAAIATTMLVTEAPITVTSASARMKPGTVWNASVMRISVSSIQPPR